MKKLIYTLALLAGTTMAAQAQTNAIKLNVTSVFVATGNVAFEHKLSDKTSFQLGAYYTGFSILDTKFSGFGITPEYRFYLSGESMQGFFLGPYLRYTHLNLKSGDYNTYNNQGQSTTTRDEASLNTFGGGVNVGYQWIFGEHFVLEPFLRVGYNGGSINTISGSDNFSTGSFKGATFLPGLNLGYAF